MQHNIRQSLVTAIIPCYNHGLYIDDAVQSILDQTHRNIEIVIIDAGSDDPYTQNKLDTYDKPRTKVVFSKTRMYPSEARNFGFSFSNGDYILTLDADDLIETTFIEKCLASFADKPLLGAVSSKVLYFGYEEGLLDYKGGSIEDVLQSMGSHLCALIRKSAWTSINGFDENMTTGFEDWEFWIRLTKNNWSIYIIPEILFFYRQKDSSRVTELFKQQFQVIEAIKTKHEDLYKNAYQYIKAMVLNNHE